MGETADKLRRICARLIDAPPDSAEAAWYLSELKSSAAELEADLAAQRKSWNKPLEQDQHQDEARQSYRSRESDSADGFAEGLKLFNPRKRDAEKKND